MEPQHPGVEPNRWNFLAPGELQNRSGCEFQPGRDTGGIEKAVKVDLGYVFVLINFGHTTDVNVKVNWRKFYFLWRPIWVTPPPWSEALVSARSRLFGYTETFFQVRLFRGG